MRVHAIPRRSVLALGVAQLVSWGVTYYLIGILGARIEAETGWSREWVYGGFSAALVVMGAASRLSGALVDRFGGRIAMSVGSLLSAGGCLVLALAHDYGVYLLAWILLGLGMRLALYDAAFASLVRAGGAQARPAMSRITLLGGLASTVFWPVGDAAADALGWRGACCLYAALALATIPLHLTLPKAGRIETPPSAPPPPAGRRGGGPRAIAALYAGLVATLDFLSAGMSAHMIPLLAGIGVGWAVHAATLRGVGQSFARACEVGFGGRLHPTSLGLIAAGLLPVAFVAAAFSGWSWSLALAFAFLYGAGNGLGAILRGALPLVLFDPRSFGRIAGTVIAPGFFFAACSPLIFARVISTAGEWAAIGLSFALSVLALVLAAALRLAARPR